MSYKNGLSVKEADYVYNKCMNEEVISNKQVYKCNSSVEENSVSDSNTYECAMLHDLNYKMSILTVQKSRNVLFSVWKMIMLKHNRKASFVNRVKFKPTGR